MNVQTLEYDRDKAAEMVKVYREHKSAQTDVDAELERIYYHISRGRKVIAALRSIVAAGLGPDGLPKLAIVRADMTLCECTVFSREIVLNGKCTRAVGTGNRISISALGGEYKRGAAIVPMIPIRLRPKASLHNYHILWEADWKQVPVDPMLLRRIGKDSWVVLAAWDLTELERSVLAARLTQ